MVMHQYKCHACDETFDSQDECDQCGQMFFSQTELDTHMQKMHPHHEQN